MTGNSGVPSSATQPVREATPVEALRSELARLLERRTGSDGRHETAIPELKLYRFSHPTEPVHVLQEPAVYVVVQGRKQVTVGGDLTASVGWMRSALRAGTPHAAAREHERQGVERGIRIYGQLVFEELFRPLVDYLQGMTWLTLPDAFRFPYEWEDASDFDPVNQVWTGGPMAGFDRDLVQIREGNSHYGYFTSVDLFPKYAPAMSEDWNTIYGLRQPVAPLSGCARHTPGARMRRRSWPMSRS